MASSHEHLKDAKKTHRDKVERIVGHTEHYKHPVDKADDLANLPYRQNEKLDPLTLPTKEKVGP